MVGFYSICSNFFHSLFFCIELHFDHFLSLLLFDRELPSLALGGGLTSQSFTLGSETRFGMLERIVALLGRLLLVLLL